jgi:proline iminopeptidase
MTRPLRRTLSLLAAALLIACGTESTPDDASSESSATQLTSGSFTAELNGHRIHHEVHGSGPAVMVVPNSWGLSLEGLRAMYRSLEERLTMVYFDPRGMGGSEPVREEADMGPEAVRADFHALREHLGLATVHAIGWSNGAANLIHLAHERPEALSSAVFLHSGASYTQEDERRIQEEFPDLAQAFGAFMGEVAADESLSDREKTEGLRSLWLDVYFPAASADPEAARPALARTFADAEFSWPHAEYTQRTWPTYDARELLPEIDVPSLVIAGAHDLLEPERVRPLAEGLPDAEFRVFEASGHFAPIEEPEAFREALFAFLGVEK